MGTVGEVVMALMSTIDFIWFASSSTDAAGSVMRFASDGILLIIDDFCISNWLKVRMSIACALDLALNTADNIDGDVADSSFVDIQNLEYESVRSHSSLLPLLQ